MAVLSFAQTASETLSKIDAFLLGALCAAHYIQNG